MLLVLKTDFGSVRPFLLFEWQFSWNLQEHLWGFSNFIYGDKKFKHYSWGDWGLSHRRNLPCGLQYNISKSL